MDLTKYDNDLSDVSDYLSDLGLDEHVTNNIDRDRYYNPHVDFVIILYKFNKINGFNLYNHHMITCLDFNDIKRRFCSVDVSDITYNKHIKNIKGDFNIISIIDTEQNNMLKTMLTLRELDNYLKENLPFYKRDYIIDEILED